MRTATIIKAIGCPHLALHGRRGDGYFYFEFDDGRRFETQSVYVNTLRQLSLEQWVSEGKDFLAAIKKGSK